jgi:hypothetical protein
VNARRGSFVVWFLAATVVLLMVALVAVTLKRTTRDVAHRSTTIPASTTTKPNDPTPLPAPAAQPTDGAQPAATPPPPETKPVPLVGIMRKDVLVAAAPVGFTDLAKLQTVIETTESPMPLALREDFVVLLCTNVNRSSVFKSPSGQFIHQPAQRAQADLLRVITAYIIGGDVYFGPYGTELIENFAITRMSAQGAIDKAVKRRPGLRPLLIPDVP